MSLLNRFFGGSKNTEIQPDISFGRYTDAYKSKEQISAWDLSLELFEQGKTMQAYRQFFQYLKDEVADNIQWREEGNILHFQFQQGSRLIIGTASLEKVKAVSRVAQADELNVGFLRRLMEQNFTLKFCRYALTEDNCLAIVFDTPATDGSPLKLLHALRELAISADKQDDLLLDEFRHLKPADVLPDNDMPANEKETKYNFIQQEIKAVFEELDRGKPDPNQFPGGYAYLFLALAFRLDYLVRPEGFMMDVLERIHSIYFAKEERNVQRKLLAIRKEFQKLLDRPKEEHFREMYRTRSTFGINPPVNQDRIKGLIEGELPNMDWHLNQQHHELALAVPQYIVGYAMFHFAPPKPIRDLFHLFFQITEQQFFRDLGFDIDCREDTGMVRKKSIEKAIKAVISANKQDYPAFKPSISKLDFSGTSQFAKSYLEMVKELDLSKAE